MMIKAIMTEMTIRSNIPYLRIRAEIEDRTIFDRDPNGITTTISFNPRQNEPAKIEGKVIKLPRKLKGQEIEIGSFRLSDNHLDQEFENNINLWNPIVYKFLFTNPSD